MDYISETDKLRFENKSVVDARKKMEASGRALQDVERMIQESDLKDSKDAASLALLYLARFVEYSILTGDAYSLEIDASKDNEFRDLRAEDYGAERERARKIEHALSVATSGDYRQVKSFLTEYGDSTLDPGSGEEELGRGIVKLLELMPDRGEPFKPGLPAWMDPKYNFSDESAD